jgi:hypothetical protein
MQQQLQAAALDMDNRRCRVSTRVDVSANKLHINDVGS